MNKPTLTKEQAKALEEITSMFGKNEVMCLNSKADVVAYKIKGHGFVGSRQAANSISHDDFILALYNGYLVEKTPEEKVIDYYHELRRGFGHCAFQPDDYRAMGVQKTLELLGIEIEGVNA